MSTLDARQTRLSADDRYELASRAQNQQRLNAPKHLIVLGTLLLIVSLITLIVAWQTQAAAADSNQRTAREMIRIENLIMDITRLQATQSTNPDGGLLDPLPDILSTLDNLGKRAGLESGIGLPRNQSARPEGDAILRSYPYRNIRDASLEDLLNWVRLAEQEIPGMHVREISIEPRTTAWSMDVVLARYERKP
tara:strand:+ start:37456 stop:38037 length:582 start_codon:yes stop_codon:yes gene_type:complete